MASSATGQIPHLAPSICSLTHPLCLLFPPHAPVSLSCPQVCPLHVAALLLPLHSISALLAMLSPIHPCPRPSLAALELLLSQQHPSSPDHPALGTPRKGQARVSWDQISAVQLLLQRRAELGDAGGKGSWSGALDAVVVGIVCSPRAGGRLVSGPARGWDGIAWGARVPPKAREKLLCLGRCSPGPA